MSENVQGQRTLPHNLEAERMLLGGLLLDAERVLEVADLVAPESFHDRRNGAIFEVMLVLSERHVPVEPVALAEALRAGGRFDQVGGHAYLLELVESVTSAAHTGYHARIVSETALLRRLIGEATQLVSDAFETRPDGKSVQSLLDEAEHRILSLALTRGGGDSRSIADLLQEAIRRVEQNRSGPSGLVTGYYDLDSMTCGFNPGDMIVLAARPGMGKTAMALNLIERMALREQPALEAGRPARVLMFSLEMGQLDLVQRLLGARAGVESQRLRERRLSVEERQALVSAADELQRADIHIDDTPGLPILALRSRARRHLHKHGLDAIVVDYLQLISHPKAESRQMEISYISRSLKGIARELKVPLIALAQLNRGVEARHGEDRRPRLSDLRESGSIEQDADLVILLHRPEKFEREPAEDIRGLCELILAKHRNGPTGLVRLQFFEETMRFENRSATAVPIAT